ncbi:protein-export chaperone SecB [Nisaea acidiphila]|uniref:Protein-export protein SecB n=1 Tax=Nisaea acidiphila TaxID=1862145 RepID=A0A9J7AWJ8_9PROT|nr:protein-export chaperone SecB [Nisaea acidiphila]UUX52187.1 protein-export chaperone SecB [Nisaea acidiphila]
MTDTETGNATDEAGNAINTFSMTVKAQYIKDLSFENPKAPWSLRADIRPEIEIGVDVRAERMADNVYEVILQLNVNGIHEGEKVFIVELAYAGVFQFENVRADQVEYVLMVECARLLFPFARQIIGQVTADGGYPPLHIQPIDFLGVFQKNELQRGENGGVDVAAIEPEGNA